MSIKFKPMESSQIKRLVLLGGLFALFGFGAWWPAYSQRQDLQQRIDAAQRELEMDLADARHLPVIHQRVASLRETLSGARRYVPREDELDQLLRDLTQAMQAHAVVNPELTTLRTERFADYSMVPMTLEFRASFPAAFGVLNRIESMARLVRVDRLEIEPATRQEITPLSVRLHLSTFFAHDQAPRAGGRS